MSKWILLAITIATLALLGGCASDGSSGYAKRKPVDQDYVQRTMALAKQRGVGVVWVHPPLASADAED